MWEQFARFVLVQPEAELRRLFDLNVEVDEVERRRAGAGVAERRRIGGGRGAGSRGVGVVGRAAVDVLKHGVGRQLPHVPLGGEQGGVEELESLREVFVLVRQADGGELARLAVVVLVVVAAAAALVLARARGGSGAQACEVTCRGACGSRSAACCCCMLLAHRYRLRRGGRRRGTLILSRSRRVTVGELGVEVDEVGEESFSFTGNAGCLRFDGMLRQSETGAGRDRRRLLCCEDADLTGKGVSLVDDAAAIDIDMASDLFRGRDLGFSDTIELCEDIRCWDCSSSASRQRDGASEQVASAAGRRTPSFEVCWPKVPRDREEEAVDAGAAIARGKETSLEVRPPFCRSADARSTDRPASSCGAVEEVEEAANADEEEETEEDGDDDDMSNGAREGATVRIMVSRVLIRI